MNVPRPRRPHRRERRAGAVEAADAVLARRTRTRWHRTTTTFGPWVKLPATLVLVGPPAAGTAVALLPGTPLTAPAAVGALLLTVLAWAIAVPVTASLWRAGER